MKNIQIKKLQLLIVLFTITIHSFAQGTYATFNIGYAFKSGSQNMTGIYNSTTPGGNGTRSYEQINTSLGKGINIGGAIGYMFNKNIGAELGLSYLIGGKTSGMHYDNNGSTENIISARMFRINPSIVIASGFEKINPYAKFGMVVGFGSVKYETNDYNKDNVENIESKSKGGSAFGVSSALGILFGINEKITLFGEITMINLTYAPATNQIIKDNYNGIDQLQMMNTREKETEFVDSYTYDPNYPRPESMPSIALKERLPFGSLGLNFGVKIGF